MSYSWDQLDKLRLIEKPLLSTSSLKPTLKLPSAKPRKEISNIESTSHLKSYLLRFIEMKLENITRKDNNNFSGDKINNAQYGSVYQIDQQNILIYSNLAFSLLVLLLLFAVVVFMNKDKIKCSKKKNQRDFEMDNIVSIHSSSTIFDLNKEAQRTRIVDI